MKGVSILAVGTAALAGGVDAATAGEWRSRSIYQLLTDRYAQTDGSTLAPCDTSDGKYCGGTWRGIIKQLDYIQGMGFTAIWISPVTYNVPEQTAYGEAYHGYWQQDLYKLNDRFGTADDLKALSKELHDRCMYLMVDIVTNHNGWNGSDGTIDYSRFKPFNDVKYYHDFCHITNYENQDMVEKCWLGSEKVELPDLRTEDEEVQRRYSEWVKELVGNYSIDGLRLDTVKHVGKPFWSSFTKASGVFSTGEVLQGDPVYTCDYQNHMDSVLNYPAYYSFIKFLNSTSGTTEPLLHSIDAIRSECKDVSLLGTFSENHDLPRFASMTQDKALAKNMLALTILWDGIPIIYAGQEQHYSGGEDPANREATWLSKYSRDSDLYKLVAAANAVRNQAIFIDEKYATYNIHPIYNNNDTVALRKGHDGKQIISVFTNTGSGSASRTLEVKNTGWVSGTTVYEILTCEKVIVSEDGVLNVSMEAGLPRIYFSFEASSGSAICGQRKDKEPTAEVAMSSTTGETGDVARVQERWVSDVKQSLMAVAGDM